jgi:hypothetical protein
MSKRSLARHPLTHLPSGRRRPTRDIDRAFVALTRTVGEFMSAQTSEPSMSLEERLRLLRVNWVLIQAASAGADAADPAAVLEAIAVCAEDGLQLLEPFQQAPRPVLDWRPASTNGGRA